METSIDLMEQKVHELDARLKQMKEERDNVIAENEELQEQLDMTNSSASVGMQKINELRNEVAKLAEEVTRIDYATTTQEHELKSLSDHMCDLNSLKETVKEQTEEISILKDDYMRMKTHLNVSAKLELQTQERMYESRLHHLENVLEEMRQREGHFIHLAEETAVLKDQVDALRELSVMVLKDESSSNRCHQQPPSAAILESPVRSQSNFSFKSEIIENNLEKEMMQNNAMTLNEDIDDEEEHVVEKKIIPEDSISSASSAGASSSEKKSILATSSPKPGIKVSGTLRLTKPLDFQKPYSSSHKRLLELEEDLNDYNEPGCAPKLMATIWSSLFD